MTERDYDRMLDIVHCTVGTAAHALKPKPKFDNVPRATNDNDVEWPLLPFPEGWVASP